LSSSSNVYRPGISWVSVYLFILFSSPISPTFTDPIILILSINTLIGQKILQYFYL